MPFQPYADRHKNLKGPGDERPTAEEVVKDQGLVGGLKGRTIFITGCTSGIGIETARALYLTGANIYITARDTKKGEQVASEFATDPSRPIHVVEMRLDSFDSIRAAAQKFLAAESKLNILIDNAGIMACPKGTTVDGHESQFGTNHLGHFLLFQLLKPALLSAETPEFPSRVISLSSTSHRNCSGLPFDDLDFSKSEYNPGIAYARSKLANIFFANELDRRYKDSNLRAFSLHPGSIKTPLQRHVQDADFYKNAIGNPEYQAQTKSPEQGAATTVWAALAKELAGRGGIYLDDVGEVGVATPEGPAWRSGHGQQIYNPEDENKLWELSNKLCGIQED
ncbi:hypothetical protein M409DRAFT_27494 [Zasmidium cellare ATCC 36951]|uniref:NAD(P)-binding protein n=1 Tax=Zasmidium cellare ATCC 36951 TaxID=1080233 RepID=A0A6A6C4Q6_ZASCE|nr:uncharacterized protein M409DRAFT_27494 [Zasmidium cellare ATCC 36951]KAF2162114.1 hypothetical protein M409DRAFT_27494 [Zasmidium cellare ATCC 36951]